MAENIVRKVDAGKYEESRELASVIGSLGKALVKILNTRSH